MQALIVIDIQNDFLPGGALEVPEGDSVVPVANELMHRFELVVASKDWHPADHKSFAANHPWRKPGDVIELNGLDQILWPIHCVQHSFGAEFAEDLNFEKFEEIFYKGTDPEIDSYSAFYDNAQRRATGMGDYLKERGIKNVYLVGLALDYCVKYTALDALELGFNTHLVIDGTRGIDKEAGDVEKAIEEMKEAGAKLIESRELLSTVTN
ncbi:MAG: bifunctional nicotinamidase/pyrazinamidase [Saprospiraceae bacterium]|nr:bifunctional nicotinamidase/pyrazinamidase [Saprospiraceae bacterium]